MASFMKGISGLVGGGSGLVGGGSGLFGGGKSRAGEKRLRLGGFTPKEVSEFKASFGTIAGQQRRLDPEKLAPKYKTRMVSVQEYNRFLSDPSTSPLRGKKGDMEGLVKAFQKRQDYVFSRRARPGIAAQTRLV